MTTDDPITKFGTGRRPMAEEFSALMREYSPALAGWACLIIAALVAFRLTGATQYHQRAAGILMSSSTLFILMALFECLWRMFVERNA
jgi:ABC-type xylose transport system permease subunit